MNMVLFWGDRGLEAVKDFERCGERNVAVHTFRKLSSVSDPAFLEPVLSVMRSEKASIGNFTAAIVRATKLQWYTWTIMHPDLPVHPDRRVFCICVSSLSVKVVYSIMHSAFECKTVH